MYAEVSWFNLSSIAGLRLFIIGWSRITFTSTTKHGASVGEYDKFAYTHLFI
ncbi:hypothetical protein BKA82DRAFT_535899 [Pisolithus tinctorius]|uniref:Uncharacterized protein n=1 Tax=Pisolithus tinctorius Marx 270 TaxID=870435 RepID=A0A0C3PB81_PISTI|nr:hypothetical protein BKA82DRAFT_535899 [Pisolithus tinctorius]KIO05211.1 hypothetical protein M404DRAFT_535899 [Pisolithus tinctorius Marx 270]